MPGRLLFLCADYSPRALLAASILEAQAADRWEAWASPMLDEHGSELVERVLQEEGLPLISPSRLIQPVFGQHWDEGVILCSGHAST